AFSALVESAARYASAAVAICGLFPPRQALGDYFCRSVPALAEVAFDLLELFFGVVEPTLLDPEPIEKRHGLLPVVKRSCLRNIEQRAATGADPQQLPNRVKDLREP